MGSERGVSDPRALRDPRRTGLARAGRTGKSYNFYDTNVEEVAADLDRRHRGFAGLPSGEYRDGAMRFIGWNLDAQGRQARAAAYLLRGSRPTPCGSCSRRRAMAAGPGHPTSTDDTCVDTRSRRMMRSATVLVAALGAAVLMPWTGRAASTRVTVSPHAPRHTSQAVSDSEEIALGAALARQLQEQRGIAPQTEQSRRIEAYLQGIARLAREAHEAQAAVDDSLRSACGAQERFRPAGRPHRHLGRHPRVHEHRRRGGRHHRARDRAHRRRAGVGPHREVRRREAPQRERPVAVEVGASSARATAP